MNSLIKETINLPERYSVTGDAEEARNQLALRSAKLTAVATAADNESAGAVVREIRAYVKAVEAVRTSITKPLFDAQKLVKSLADDHCAPLLAEQQRIERLAVAFAQAEARRVAREEEERQAAYRKAEAERAALEEKARLLAEKANTEKQQVTAIKTAQAAELKAAEVAAVLATQPPVAAKSKGQQVRKELRVEVTDIRALYAARPDLVKMEVNLAGVKATCVPEVPVPGLKLWWAEKVVFSSAGSRF